MKSSEPPPWLHNNSIYHPKKYFQVKIWPNTFPSKCWNLTKHIWSTVVPYGRYPTWGLISPVWTERDVVRLILDLLIFLMILLWVRFFPSLFSSVLKYDPVDTCVRVFISEIDISYVSADKLILTASIIAYNPYLSFITNRCWQTWFGIKVIL